jgi:hypothetical protein
MRGRFAGRAVAALCFALGAALLPVAGRGQAAGFKPEEYRLLPVRVHLLRSHTAPGLNGTMTESDVTRILGKVNGIWRPAGLAFFAESVLTETAASGDLYQALGEGRTEAHLRLIRPRDSRSAEMFHVYYVREIRPNGVCLSASHELIFVKEKSQLFPVPGGIDEPLPRVTAHEIGHALTLPHRQDRVNLMASGTTGTSLNQQEIDAARKAAEALPWRMDPDQALRRARELAAAEQKPGATALYGVLAALPAGPVATAAQRGLDRLNGCER